MHINFSATCIHHIFIIAHDTLESILALEGISGRVNVRESSFGNFLLDSYDKPIVKVKSLSRIKILI
jgi:hypothetical protein